MFYMSERLLEQKEAVATVLCLCGMSSLCLSEEDRSMVSLSVDALRPFEEVTKEISTEKLASVSKVIPLVTLLHLHPMRAKEPSSPLSCQHIANTISELLKPVMVLLSACSWTQDLKTLGSVTWQILKL